MSKVIIIANGHYPTKKQSLDLINKSDIVICCDGAIDKCMLHGILPSVIVGDGDSMSEEQRKALKRLFVQDSSTEYNDLQKAFKYCQQQGYKEVTIVGCEGEREDHFIANLSIMVTYSEEMDIVMITDYGEFQVIRKSTTFTSKPGQQVSIFCKDTELPLTFEGLKYPVNNRCFKHFWEGSLNEALNNRFTITLHKEGVVLVYLADQCK